MSPNEKYGSPDEKNGERMKQRTPGERATRVEDVVPLAEEIEREMEDQDIPMETGVKPGTKH